MKWFTGSIPAAIQQSKTNKCLFVVYVHGDDDASKKMNDTWENSEVTQICEQSNFVALKLEAKSESCTQFSQIYPIVIIPSTFFIGDNGVPLEVTGGYMESTQFIKNIKKTLELHKAQSQGSAVTNPTVTEAPSSQTQSLASGTNSLSQGIPLEDRVERAKKIIEEKQAQTAIEAEEEERKKETERRNLGKNMVEAKRWREEYQAKETKEQLRKDKEEERKAREKVRAQIAKDREERAARFKKEKEERETAASEVKQAKLEAQAEAEAEKVVQKSEIARIQFRLPNGSSVFQQFPSSDTLYSTRNFIAQHVVDSLGNSFVMKTTFPKRTFCDADMKESLLDLDLAPSSVILVLPGDGRVRPVGGSGSGSFMQMILAPLLALWGFIYNFLFGTPAQYRQPSREEDESTGDQTPSQTSNRPKTAHKRRTPNTTAKQTGNIHRLGGSASDDDENATWNGNSTQQM